MTTNLRNLLDDAAGALAGFLNDELPSLAGSNGQWWETRVLSVLSERQQDAVARSNAASLLELDLASLLRVIDNNWRLLDDRHTFPQGALNFIKEMYTVRNRWHGHQPAGYNPTPADIYRDLDTLERFLNIVKASDELLTRVREERLATAKLLFHSEPQPQREISSQAPDDAATAAPESPPCPICGSSMLLRVARTGPRAGGQFWGCSRWTETECKGIVNIAPTPSPAPPSALPRTPASSPQPDTQSPACPFCDSAMIKRTARTGPYAGNQFWGCSQWSITGCNGLVNIAAPSQPEPETVDDLDDLPF